MARTILTKYSVGEKMPGEKKSVKKATKYKITLQNGSVILRDIDNTDADELKVLKGKGYKVEEV